MQNNNQNQLSSFGKDEVDLRELFSILIGGKWIITIVTLSASILVVLYSLSMPDIYKSSAVLIPVQSSNSLSGALKSYSGLASIAGINLGSQDMDNNSVKAMEKITSFSFFKDNIYPNIFLPELMAVESWEKETGNLKFNKSIYDVESGIWIRQYKYPQKQIPSEQESFQVFKKNLTFTESKQTGFITLSIEHQSPYIAKEWADLLINQINAFYREKDRNEALKSVDYLNSQIIKTNFSEIKQVIAALIQQKTQKLTLIESSEAYVFEYIDPPVVMERKSGPFRALICILGSIVGVILGVFIVLINHFRLKPASI